MKIDSHQHFWKFDPLRDAWISEEMSALRADFMPEDLVPLLQSSGIDGCVAVQADQSETETRFLLQLAEQNEWIKGVVGWLDLQADDIEKKLQEYAAHPKLVGLRHIVQAEPDHDFLLRPEFCRGLSLLPEYGLTYDILVYHTQLPEVLHFADRFPEQPFVLDHLGKPPVKSREIREWESNIRRLARHPQVFCKFSGMSTEDDWASSTVASLQAYADVVIDAFGPGRLMFGSDWPVCLLAQPYGKWVDMADELIGGFTKEEKSNFWGANACRFYKLN